MRALGCMMLLGLALIGCDSAGQLSVRAVTGQVFAGKDKKPAAGCMVIFHPVQPDGGKMYRPSGQVDSKGQFTLSTYSQGDGAPAGEYIITLTWIPERKGFSKEGEDLLRGAYADPKSSKLPRFTVKDGAANEVPPIYLP